MEVNVADAKEAFERDGFLHLRDCLPPRLLEPWQRFSDQHFQETFQALYENRHISFPNYQRQNHHGSTGENACYTMGQGIKQGFREIVMRSPGRFELSLTHLNDQKRPSLQEIERILSSIVPNLLGAAGWDECKVCSLSLVTSTPGAPDQTWHADGGHVDLQHHVPCHCLNVFIPLEDVTEELGPTEFRPGSHFHTRNLVPLLLAAKARRTLRPPVTPIPHRGDAVIFDYRVLHRGRANSSARNRAVLVITVAQPWFKDVLNFPTRSLREPKPNHQCESHCTS